MRVGWRYDASPDPRCARLVVPCGLGSHLRDSFFVSVRADVDSSLFPSASGRGIFCGGGECVPGGDFDERSRLVPTWG
ncbi:MAG: hypothetical protein AAFX40_11440 [Cyanobacteria bacterium J06639_1]